MATVLIPFTVQVNLKGHIATGEELLHVFDAIAPNALPTSADVAAVAAAVQSWVTGTFGPTYVRATDVIDQIVCTTRAQLNGPQTTVPINTAGGRAPGAGGIYLPSDITLALKKSTGLAGRSFRGRFYVWPFFSTDLDPTFTNIITPTFSALVLNVYNVLRTGMTGAGYPLGVTSEVHATTTPVKAFALVDDTVDNQRRRLPGRGA